MLPFVCSVFIASVSTVSTTTEEPVDTKSKSRYKRGDALWAVIAHSWPDLVAARNLGLNKDRESEGRVGERERKEKIAPRVINSLGSLYCISRPGR